MWTKYDYLCTDCDALIEVTTLQDLRRDVYGSCPCGSNKTISIGVGDAFEPVINTVEELDYFKKYAGIAIDALDVMKVTPREVVKINTNPYN